MSSIYAEVFGGGGGGARTFLATTSGGLTFGIPGGGGGAGATIKATIPISKDYAKGCGHETVLEFVVGAGGTVGTVTGSGTTPSSGGGNGQPSTLVVLLYSFAYYSFRRRW